MVELTPRTNTELFGHDAAEAQLMRDFAAGKLAHGWIISGPRGIGKATLAYRFARTLLGGRNRIAAGSHADLLVVEQLYDEKKEENAREISVEQAREIAQFLSLTPGEGQWRVVIVDSADALNANAANAILKILEEPPPQSVLLLVSHAPGRLLPTIRSRCRMLRLAPLNAGDFAAAMRHIAPDMGSNELASLAQMAGHAPGVALELHEACAMEIYAELLDMLSTLPAFDALKIHAFADRMTSGQAHKNWQTLTRLMLCLLERISLHAAGMEIEPLSYDETRALHALASFHPAQLWANKWQQCANQFSLAEARHLDYKQVIITFFHSLMSKELMVLSA